MTVPQISGATEPPFSKEIQDGYLAVRKLPNGKWCGVVRLVYHWSLHVDISEWGYEDRYCFETLGPALVALTTWDGTGDPVGWRRHPGTARRRNLETGEEWIQPRMTNI